MQRLAGWDFMGNFTGDDSSYYTVPETDEFGNPYDTPAPTYTPPATDDAASYGPAYDSMTPQQVADNIEQTYGYTPPASAAPLPPVNPMDIFKLIGAGLPGSIAAMIGAPTVATVPVTQTAAPAASKSKTIMLLAAVGIGAFLLLKG